MFVYLRYFYAISLILVVAGAVIVGSMIRSMTAENLSLLVREHDLALAEQYVNHIWDRHYPRKELGPERYEKLAMFKTESEKYVAGLPKLRFTVTSPTGQLVFRSSESSLRDDSDEDIGVFRHDATIESEPVSRTIEDISWHTDTNVISRTVIQTIIPIVNAAYNPAADACQPNSELREVADVCQPIFGAIEIVSDVTKQWNDIFNMQMITSASIIGIFAVLISILFFTTNRAEAIIARQHEANLELIAAASAAEAENQDKSQFLANISHELRTPLNAIIGFSEIIKNEALVNLNPTHQEYIRDIHGSGKHLLSLINDILDYSKAEAGKLELNLTEIDLTKLLVNSMRLVIPRAEEAQVRLTEALPTEHIVCTTDAKKLKQVILNLLSNAVKFTPAGGEVRIEAFQKLIDGSVEIKVIDSGIGIAPKDIAKVMSPFGQVDSKLSRKYEGTGLGLPLSRKFIEAMNGKFEIESEINVGTTIIITLPAELPKE